MSPQATRLAEPLRPRPGDLRAPSAARPGAHLRGDQLLHRHPDRASARPRRRAARGDGLTVRASTSRATSGRSSSPRPHDLEPLFGVDIHEMQPYRPLPEQIAEQIAARRTLIVELDSWYLPDTAATSYRQRAREELRRRSRRSTADGRAAALLPRHRAATSSPARTTAASSGSAAQFSDDVLPPYTELVRFDAGPRAAGRGAARAASLGCSREHLDARPRHESVRAVRRAAPDATCRGCSRATPPTTTPMHSPPCAWPASAFEVGARYVTTGCSVRRRRCGGGGLHADRRGLQGALVPLWRAARTFDPETADRRPGRRVGRGGEPAR